jgi:hypothetical protein
MNDLADRKLSNLWDNPATFGKAPKGESAVD